MHYWMVDSYLLFDFFLLMLLVMLMLMLVVMLFRHACDLGCDGGDALLSCAVQ